MIRFVVPGEPRGKGRPRFAKRGKFVKTYTDDKTAAYENLVKLAADEAMMGREPYAIALSATIDVELIPAKSLSKRNRAAALAGEIHPMKKPDLDNVVKSILDALNGIVYVDDSQVVDLVATKRYKEAARVVVYIRPAGKEPDAGQTCCGQ